jgi:hypothetical protein
MAEVQVEMADINAVLNSNPTFAQAVQVAAMTRRIDELEAEKAAITVCDCKKDDLSEE